MPVNITFEMVQQFRVMGLRSLPLRVCVNPPAKKLVDRTDTRGHIWH